jgi:DNA-binding MarR family transcriptional regulator
VTSANGHLAALADLLASNPRTRQVPIRHLQVLGEIVAAQRALSVTEIAVRVRLSSSHTTRVTQAMLAGGLLRRVRHEDERLACYQPTERGVSLDADVRALIAPSNTTVAP